MMVAILLVMAKICFFRGFVANIANIEANTKIAEVQDEVVSPNTLVNIFEIHFH